RPAILFHAATNLDGTRNAEASRASRTAAYQPKTLSGRGARVPGRGEAAPTPRDQRPPPPRGLGLSGSEPDLMAMPTALLITRDASLVGPVQEAIGSVAHLGLRTVADLEDVYSLVRGPEVALLLLHIPRSAGPAPAQQLLKYVAGLRRQIAVVILSDQNEPEQALTLLRLGAAEDLDRPLDLRRLAYRADVLPVRARPGRP